MKGKVSKTGYRKNSPDRHNDFNIIPSGNISMHNVLHPVFGVDELGTQQMMYPNRNYQFPGSYVTEFPMSGYHQMPDGSMMADNEMKRGGQHKRKTSKNIKSSINELFLRNYQVYGPHGHHNIYDPNAKKEGGEHMKKLIPMPPMQFFYNGHAPNPWMEMGGEIDFDDPDYEEFKQGGIHIAKNKRGTFTAAATKHGQGVQEFARHVLANKDKFSSAMVKKAVFAANAKKWNKKQYGGIVEGDEYDLSLEQIEHLESLGIEFEY